MTVNETVINTHEQALPLLSASAIELKPNKPKKAAKKIRLECPRCFWIFEVQAPDERHTICTFAKPEKRDLTEEPRVCRNPKCKKQFALYWHKPATQTKKA